MRRNILLLAASTIALAMLPGCDNTSNQANQANNASNETAPANESTPPPQTERASAGETTGSVATPSAEVAVNSMGFARTAAMGDMYEINASKIALERSQSEPVKSFAQQMIDAHDKMTTDLKGVLPPSASQMLPSELDAEHQEMIRNLKEASDEDFNKVYLAQQDDAHKQALTVFRSYAANGDDARLKEFAQNALSSIQGHLDQVATLSATGKTAASKSRKKAAPQ